MSLTLRMHYYIDFDNDGIFLEVDDIAPWVKDAIWSLGMHQPNQLTGDETKLDLTLKNEDRRFSPEYSDGPYYGLLRPNLRLKVEASLGGVDYPMYLGWIETIAPAPLDGTTATISCISAKNYIQEQLIRMPLLENVRSDEVIRAILERLTLPPSAMDIWQLGIPGNSELGVNSYISDLAAFLDLDVGLKSFSYVADNWDASFQGNQYVNKDWSTGFKGYQAILDVVRAERGRFFFNREGKARFWARDRLQLKTSVDESYTQDNFQRAHYRYGGNIFNDIRVMVYPRQLDSSPSQIWELDEPIALKRDKTQTITARFNDDDSDIKVSAVEPTISHISSLYSVNIKPEWNASSAKLLIENTALRPNNRVDEIIINARRLTDYNSIEIQAIDGESVARYGMRELRIDSKLMDDVGFGQNVADYELSRLKDARGEFISVERLVRDDGDALNVLTRQMGDRIRFSDVRTGHDKEYFIIGEKHQRSLAFGYHVIWYLEEADMSKFWVLGVEGFGELGEVTWLGL